MKLDAKFAHWNDDLSWDLCVTAESSPFEKRYLGATGAVWESMARELLHDLEREFLIRQSPQATPLLIFISFDRKDLFLSGEARSELKAASKRERNSFARRFVERFQERYSKLLFPTLERLILSKLRHPKFTMNAAVSRPDLVPQAIALCSLNEFPINL